MSLLPDTTKARFSEDTQKEPDLRSGDTQKEPDLGRGDTLNELDFKLKMNLFIFNFFLGLVFMSSRCAKRAGDSNTFPLRWH